MSSTKVNAHNQISNLPHVFAATYDFAPKSPGGSLTSGITNTVTLAPVPFGVNGSDSHHYVYISGGTGTAEAVLITGGTAVGGAASGTITFVPANNHSGAWTVSSDSGGIEEAINALPSTGGEVEIAANTTILTAGSIWITKANVVIRGNGPSSIVKARNSAALDTVFLVSTVSGIWFRDFKVDGNRSNAGTNATNGTGISLGLYGLGGGSNGGVVNCEITACNKIGIVISDTNSNISIYGNYIHHNGGVVDATGSGMGILTTTSGSNAVPFDVRIIGNTIEFNYNTVTGPGPSGALLTSGADYIVANNYIRNNYNASGGQLSTNGIISGNIIIRTGGFGGDLTCGVEVAGPKVVIVNNIVSGHSTSAGIVLEGNPAGAGGLGASDVVIANNYILTAPDGISIINAGGYVRGVSIQGNRVVATRGLFIDTSAVNISVTGNNFLDSGTILTDNSTFGAIYAGNYPIGEGNRLYKGTVASATTITIGNYRSATISGVTAIETISVLSSVDAGYEITLIPSGIWTTTTAGNIGLGSTSVVGKAMKLIWDGTKWWPSY